MDKEMKRNLWKQRVQDFKASGLSMKKWSELYDVKYHQLQYWVQKLSETNQPSIQWLPVDVPTEERMEEGLTSFKIKMGPFELVVDSQLDIKALKRVLKVLMELC